MGTAEAFAEESVQALVMKALQPASCLTMDQLLARLPELRWNEVFHSVDALSREGKICLRRRGFEYEIGLLAHLSCA